MWLYLIVSLTAFAGFLIGRRSERPAGRIAAGVCFAVLLLSTVFGLMRSAISPPGNAITTLRRPPGSGWHSRSATLPDGLRSWFSRN